MFKNVDMLWGGLAVLGISAGCLFLTMRKLLSENAQPEVAEVVELSDDEKKAKSDEEYQKKYQELLFRIVELLRAIKINYVERGAGVGTKLAVVKDEVLHGELVRDGVFSKTYLSLLETLRLRIDVNIFTMLLIINQKIITTSMEGNMREQESPQACEERRELLLKSLERARVLTRKVFFETKDKDGQTLALVAS